MTEPTPAPDDQAADPRAGRSSQPAQPASPPRVGIDIGGVIIADSGGDDEVFFSPRYLATPELPGAFDAIAELATWATCYLVSKVGTTKEQRCRRWLFAHQFPRRCAIPPERWFFVPSRAAKGLLAQQLCLDGFVDDHQDVLDAMPSSVRCRVLFAAHPRTVEGDRALQPALSAPDWPAALDALTRTLRAGTHGHVKPLAALQPSQHPNNHNGGTT